MKAILMTLTILVSQSIFANCNSEVRSKAINEAVKAAFEETINRMDNAYQNALSLNGFTTPKICSFEDYNDIKIMEVSSMVSATIWYEDGGKESVTEECFVWIEKVDGEWAANQVICDNILDVDEEV